MGPPRGRLSSSPSSNLSSTKPSVSWSIRSRSCRSRTSIGGYSLGGADLLRRAMGKKDAAEMEKQREIFLKGAAERKFPKSQAGEIFDQMAKFAGYGFNKSHSAAYSLLAYHTHG